jgi:hypothetical protein
LFGFQSHDELLEIAVSQVPPTQQERHLSLLGKNPIGLIAPQERQELSDLRLTADRLMGRKAYTRTVLRW